MTFEEWFNQYDWWHENSSRETLSKVWETLEASSIESSQIVDVFDDITSALRNEYGE